MLIEQNLSQKFSWNYQVRGKIREIQKKSLPIFGEADVIYRKEK